MVARIDTPAGFTPTEQLVRQPKLATPGDNRQLLGSYDYSDADGHQHGIVVGISTMFYPSSVPMDTRIDDRMALIENWCTRLQLLIWSYRYGDLDGIRDALNGTDPN